MKTHLPPRSRGFMLWEMIFVLGLFSIFMTVAARIFHSSFMLIGATSSLEMQAAGFDHAIAALRRDVWQSRRAAAEARKLTLELPGDRRVEWSATEQGGLIRTEKIGSTLPDIQRWTNLPALAFTQQASAITIIAATKGRNESIEMVIPALLPEPNP